MEESKEKDKKEKYQESEIDSLYVGTERNKSQYNDKSSDLYNKVSPSNLTIITCDTVVVNDNKIIGKPKDEKDAINILLSLSNKKHFVSSAVCVYKDGKYNIGLEKTFVTFRDITLKEIETYIKNNKPFDKAGSYGIQDEGFDFVKEIDGNIDNVIGLPLNTLKTLL